MLSRSGSDSAASATADAKYNPSRYRIALRAGRQDTGEFSAIARGAKNQLYLDWCSGLVFASILPNVYKGFNVELHHRFTPKLAGRGWQCANEQRVQTFIARRSHVERCFRSAHWEPWG